jgi:S-formylglutathione hydrolase FrmB/lysophospholipase L1-like esterase
MVEGFGPVLERELRKVPELTVKRAFKSATGLCRPDFFDWFAFMGTLLAENEPELVIVSLGANDTQDIVTEDRERHKVASEGWNEEYAARVRRILDMAGDSGASVFWVGLPIMGKKTYNERVENLNAVVAAACGEALNCRFFDTWTLLADESGKFAAYRTLPGGKHERIRAKDSIHLTESGAEIMVEAFLQAAGGWGIYGIPEAGPAAREPSAAGGGAPGGPQAGADGSSGAADAADGAGPEGTAPSPASGEAPAAAPGAEDGETASLAAAAARLAALRPQSPRAPESYPAEAIAPAALLEVNLPSRARSKETSYLLCIPGPDDLPRPTVLLLHGPDEGYQVWRERFGGDLVDLARRLNANLIMPDGDPYGWYLDSPVKRDSRLESYILRELLPDAAGRFRLDPARVGLLGVSMGGHGALTLALKHPETFQAAGSVSGITVLESHASDPEGSVPFRLADVLGPYRPQSRPWLQNGAYHLTRRSPQAAPAGKLSLSVGLADPVALAENRQYHRLLEDLSISHDYRELPGGVHGWELWTSEIPRQLALVAGSL